MLPHLGKMICSAIEYLRTLVHEEDEYAWDEEESKPSSTIICGELVVHIDKVVALYRHPNIHYARRLINSAWVKIPAPPPGLEAIDIVIIMLASEGYSFNPRSFAWSMATDATFATVWKLIRRSATIDVHAHFLDAYTSHRDGTAYSHFHGITSTETHYYPPLLEASPGLYAELERLRTPETRQTVIGSTSFADIRRGSVGDASLTPLENLCTEGTKLMETPLDVFMDLLT